MDNICHTLVGAALAEAGLRRRTRFGTATLLVGARDARPIRGGQVALLATVSILTHPLLDFMNTYGMRWWMPFVNRWYYADALFIVDPWIWVVLVAGIVLTGQGKGKGGTRKGPSVRRRLTPASVALLVVAVYAVVMLGASQIARRAIVRELAAQGRAPLRVMVSPVPLNPLRRLVVIEEPDRYRFGTVNWLRRPAFAVEPYEVAKNATAPEALVARQSAEGRAFLSWARFPFFVVEASRSHPVVHIVDARYTLDPDAGFGAVAVHLQGR